MANPLNDFGLKIFLDRYAQKDTTKATLAVDDLVVVCVNQKTRQREVGNVVELLDNPGNKPRVRIKLLDGSEVTQDWDDVDKPTETTPEQTMARTARGIAGQESEEKRAEWEEKFKWLLDEWRFVPGGRILAAAGTEQALTFFNCYVLPSPKDSRTGIVETLSSMMEIMSRGGGVGINLSSLRPRHNYVKGVNGRSSGSISWGGLYSFVTGLIEQGGCFAPYTRILTDRGNIPVLEIVEGMERGEKYQAWTHKGWRAITDRFRNGRKTVYRLTTDQGYTLDITGEHKVMTMDGSGTFGLVKLDKLSAGDSVMILRGSVPNDIPYAQLVTDVPKDVQGQDVRLPAELDEDLAYVLGYYVGNGSIANPSARAPHTVTFAVPHNRPETLRQLTETLERLFGRHVSHTDGDGALTRVAVCSRQLVRYFDTNGLTKAGSIDARAPEQVFRSRRSVIEAFVGGWFAADGCNRGAKGGFGIDTVSYQGAMDVQKLLQMLGVVSRIATQTRETEGWNTIYRVVVSGSYMCSEMAKWLGDYTDKVNDLPLPVKNHAYTWPVNFNGVYKSSFTPKFNRVMPPWNGTTSQAAIAHVRDNVELLTEEQAEHFQYMDNCVHDTITSIEKLGVMDTYDLTVDEVHCMSGDGIYVSNSRRGALMLILNLDHPDVLDFIDAKREAGKITNANISVAIPDAFMDAVASDGEWNLVFPDTTHAAYDAEWNGDLKAWRAKGYPVVTHKTVKARELWTKIATSAWASAEPGILFIDRVNQLSNSHYFSPLICTNPCFPGDTRVHTSRGLVKASELYASQENLNLVSDSRFGNAETLVPSTPVFLTAKSAQLHKITTVEGYEVRATEDHRFMTTEGWKHLKDLCEGDKIHIVNRGTHIHSTDEEGDAALGRILGWLVGDGFMHAASGVVLSFYGDKRDLVPAFQQDVHTVIGADLSPVTGHETELRLASTRLASKVAGFGITSTEDKVQVPELVFSGSTATQRGFLQALFSSDGTVADSENGTRSVRLSASKLEFLRDVQLLLLNFGVYSKIYKDRHEAGYRKLPDGNGGLSSYFCQATHDLVVSKADIRTFYEAVGFLPGSSKQKQLRLLVGCYTFYKSNFLARVESVLPDGVEDVYDVTEPLNHSVVINGFVSHNCGEQPLPAWGICNLGAINLGVHVDDNGKVKWDELKQTVRYAVRFLDNVIDATPYFIDENKKQQQNERRVGLGIMGLAEMLVKCGVRYGSKAGVAFVDELGKFIATEAYTASSDYAAEKGAFPAFDADKLLDSGFMKGMPKSVRSLIKKQGLRNVTLLTVAPTGTTGTMVDTSTGVEPYFSWTYWRKSRLGMNEIEVDIVKDWRKANPDAKDLPDYFVTAMELSPEEHVVMQGALQRWIDSALSKTCNAPNNYTVENVQDLYELMYKLGCKGGTIYRDGSRDEQVLMLKAEPAAAEPAPALDIDAEARKLGYIKPEDVLGDANLIAKVLATAGVQVQPEPVSRRRKDKVMQSINCKQQTHLGSCYTDVTYDRNNDPLEIFVRSGKAGSDVASLAEGLGRLASTLLTMPSPVPPMERLRDIAGHLEGIGGSDSVGFGRAQIKSMPDAVGKSLLIIADELDVRKGKVTAAEPEEKVDESKPVRKSKKAAADICPSCGGATYIREEGCKHCTSCGHSACG